MCMARTASIDPMPIMSPLFGRRSPGVCFPSVPCPEPACKAEQSAALCAVSLRALW